MRDYGKVHTSFWSSTTTRSMSEDGRALSLYLLTCSHGTLAGVFRAPDGYICEDMQWSSERVQKTLSELLAKGFANRCETTKWLWVIKHLEWNPPENPNQKKSAAKLLAQVPDECAWKPDYIRVFGDLLGVEQPPKPKPLENPSKTLPQPVTVTVTVDKPNPSVASLPADDGGGKENSKIPDCPQQKILDAYSQHLPMLTQPRLWEGNRAELLRSRWRALSKPNGVTKGYATQEEGIAFFAKFFAYVAKSPKLTQGIPHDKGEGVWQPDLPWLLKAENFLKVVEGKFHT